MSGSLWQMRNKLISASSYHMRWQGGQGGFAGDKPLIARVATLLEDASIFSPAPVNTPVSQRRNKWIRKTETRWSCRMERRAESVVANGETDRLEELRLEINQLPSQSLLHSPRANRALSLDPIDVDDWAPGAFRRLTKQEMLRSEWPGPPSEPDFPSSDSPSARPTQSPGQSQSVISNTPMYMQCTSIKGPI